MAGAVKQGGLCPLCREKGREGRLELRQINASEALWICGNLKCPYPMYLDVLTVTSVIPELLCKESGATLEPIRDQNPITVGPTRDQNPTTMYHSSTAGDHGNWSRDVAAGEDQNDQMAAAASSSPKYKNSDNSSSSSNTNHSSSSFSATTTTTSFSSAVPSSSFSSSSTASLFYNAHGSSVHPEHPSFFNQSISLVSNDPVYYHNPAINTSSAISSHQTSTDTRFHPPTDLDQENILDELSEMFDTGQSSYY